MTEVSRREENSEKYMRMKKIKKKYSNIVLTKRDSQRTRLEITKAAHSLDLGLNSSGNIYKPNFKRMKSLNKVGGR